MDAVELAIPAAVAVPKFMGSEGGLGGSGVTVNEVEVVRESDRISIVVSPSVERCGSLVSHKDVKSAVTVSERAVQDNIPPTECLRHPSQVPNFQGEDVPEQLRSGGSNSSVVSLYSPDNVQLQRKAGKVSRSASGCSKRLRTAQLGNLLNQDGVDVVNGVSDGSGSFLTKYICPEKALVIKQQNNSNGKRGEKRNFKVHSKTKNDSFSLKAGLMSFTQTGGGNNILGIYGLKSDLDDVTKHVDTFSLNELLDGGYKCPSLGKDKGKRAANVNENFLHSIRKACSILQLQRHVKSQNFSETESNSGRKLPPSPLSSASCLASCSSSAKGDTNATDLSIHNKDSGNKPEAPFHMLDSPLLQPKDVLDRLALPPPKDLDSLLLDAGKPAILSRNGDSRTSKLTSNRAYLPPFPWSHNFSGHCKTNSDAAKLSSSRMTCQGRWTRIENAASFLGIANDSFTDLKSLAYDHSLVPSGELKSGISGNGITPSLSVSLLRCEVGSSSSGTCPKASLHPESDGNLENEIDGAHSPRLLAAAQTLHKIAARSLTHNPCGMIKWPNKPSQKAMKARKLKFNEKPEESFAAPKSVMRYDNPVKSANQILPSKKPRLTIMEKKKDLAHVPAFTERPINWSAPKSCRSSPSRSARDLVAETKHFGANVVKQSCMLPPAPRVSEKACTGQPKLRKMVPMDWNRAREKLD